MEKRCCIKECSCDNIPEHRMCQLTLPMGNFDLEKVKKLTSDPKFICTCCGRTANKRENLCSPVEL
ncbi:MAG: hypothetical protein JSV92_01205 [archaeon]|nr:MAG: hypothetical protein JSV92_01205 [archaeon]